MRQTATGIQHMINTASPPLSYGKSFGMNAFRIDMAELRHKKFRTMSMNPEMIGPDEMARWLNIMHRTQCLDMRSSNADTGINPVHVVRGECDENAYDVLDIELTGFRGEPVELFAMKLHGGGASVPAPAGGGIISALGLCFCALGFLPRMARTDFVAVRSGMVASPNNFGMDFHYVVAAFHSARPVCPLPLDPHTMLPDIDIVERMVYAP